MAYEAGGRADKSGNRFEYNWTINKMLDVLNEKIQYLTIEAVGDDERGVDLWIGNKDGTREGQQCKGRCRNNEYWTYGEVNEKGIWDNWKVQLENSKANMVSLVSPLAFNVLEDITQMARNTDAAKPRDFYEYQIRKSGKKTVKFFHHYCDAMGINPAEERGIATAIDYMSRTFYRNPGNFGLREILLQRIELLFVGDAEEIFSKLLKFVLLEDIWGKKIDALMITDYCKDTGIVFRDLARDERILPVILNLNEEYQSVFIKFQSGYIIRNEAKSCWQWILDGKSVIIHGHAGMGKSGCIENIIQFCKESETLYLAVKLDKRIPHETAERWGQSMGLPASVSHCLNAVSCDKRAVLIFDQLDALRWTQAHSSESLAICRKIIREVEQMNQERRHKISIVMVCRTYDLENDNNIQGLFKDSARRGCMVEWARIRVDKLSQEEVEKVVGSVYKSLSPKTRDLLSTASNLYIWEHLDVNREVEICTKQQLVREWWGQLKSKADRNGFDSDKLEKIKDNFIKYCDRSGKMYASCSRLNMPEDYRNFLQSNGFFVLMGDKVSLVHQSILDCFFAEHMLDQFYDDVSLSDIIGEKDRQTPGRRYQVQMFLQLLLEDSEEDFLAVGERLLELTDVRYNVKYVFIEILSQITELDKKVFKFVRRFLWDDRWGKHFRSIVVLGKQAYVRKLRECGDLDIWMQYEDKYSYVTGLFRSIIPNCNVEDIAFLQKYVLDPDKADEWIKCLVRDIHEGSEAFFELKLSYYRQFPQSFKQYKNILLGEKIKDLRSVQLVALMLEQHVDEGYDSLYRYDEVCVSEDANIFKTQYKNILEILMPFIPMEDQGVFSRWSARYSGKHSLERVCIQIIKSANRHFAQNEPELFLSKVSCYIGTGVPLHNELILDSFQYLPDLYADYILEYMCGDFEERIFECTSGNGDKLLLAKAVLEKNAVICSDEAYSELEFCIIHYKTPDAKERLYRRIEYNKTKKKGDLRAYWKFCGDLQNDLLGILPLDRMGKEAKELKTVFGRSYENDSIYQYNADCKGGGVNSPIAGKKLNFNDWKRILLNNELPSRKFGEFKEKNGRYIDNSLEAFASEFQKAVSDAPVEFLQNILKMEEEINAVFVRALARGIAYSNKHDEVDNGSIEELFLKYPYDYGTGVALEYCEIIERKQDILWSESTLDMLCSIIHRRREFIQDKSAEDAEASKETVEKAESKMLYSVVGVAVQAIGGILFGNRSALEQFKAPFDELVDDVDFVSRYACVYALWTAYHIDRDWAIARIRRMFLSNFRLAGISDRGIHFALYNEDKEIVQNVLRNGFCSDDGVLKERCGESIAEMYLIYDDFDDIFDSFPLLDEQQKKAMVGMLIVYLGIDKYHEKAKKELSHILEYNDEKLIDSWSGLFYKNRICLSQDRDFLMQLMTSELGAKMMFAFEKYISKHGSLLDYSDIILKMAYYILEDADITRQDRWLIERDLIKLVWGLYDEANSEEDKDEDISSRCLDIWDLMFEKQIGETQELTRKMMEL